jgi:hypothetical protein
MLTLALSAALPAAAEGLTAKQLLPDVEKCSLKLTGNAPEIDPEAQAMVLRVEKATLAKGLTAHLFYFAPGKDGKADDFGLILDGPPALVAKALPRYAAAKRVNGYTRELRTIGDPDGTGGGEDKTLLVCTATPA